MQKIDAVNHLRVLAMLMVIFYHCIACYSVWNGRFASNANVYIWDVSSKLLSSVHVPLFLIISGFLYSYKRKSGSYSATCSFLMKKFERIGIPYIFWAIFFASISLYSWSTFTSGMAHLWFLMVLFECCMLGRILDVCWRNNTSSLMAGLLMVPYLLYIPYMVWYEEFLCLGSLARYLPYYLVGCSLGSVRDFCNLYKGNHFLLLVLSIVVTGMFLLSNTHILRMCRPLLSTAFLIMLLYMGMQFIHNTSKYVEILAECSMGMYIVHQPLIHAVSLIPAISDFRDTHYYLYPIILFCLLLPLSFCLVYALRKIKLFRVLLG